MLPSQRRDSASWNEIFAELQDELRLDRAPRDRARHDRAALDPATGDIASADAAIDAGFDDAMIDQPAHWLPPVLMEPMTDDEAEQARSLLSAQRIAIEALERRKKATGRHLAVVRSLPGTRGTAGPAYLDISG
ncbi:MAG: hypothetical protein QOG18_1775 [Microbacteriaceae bacterium]|nr:hypothetical protein [Microbacteriaceae bacterium]MDQ1527162.1 hypothetical protein [Microbacteriaceae bacterium]MDQ1577683.1 hypothetical protein [Microbacteriaceae bacterium]